MNIHRNLNIVKQHWENPDTISLKDKNLQELERGCIINFLENIKKKSIIADVGCGNAEDTIFWTKYSDMVIGYDYSSEMIKKAKKISKNKIQLFRLDLLKDNLHKGFDVVITKRCLINLGNFTNQKKAILKIHNSLKSKGYYCMLECSIDGLNNLNIMRRKIGLKPISLPFHNVYFNLDKLKKFISRYFYIIDTKYFSSYYFLTRIYNQILDKNKFQKFDKVAKNIQMSLDVLNSKIIGPQFLMILHKKI